jgi:hypothetical protein
MGECFEQGEKEVSKNLGIGKLEWREDCWSTCLCRSKSSLIESRVEVLKGLEVLIFDWREEDSS